MPTNAAKKALAKAKRGIVSTGACSTKASPDFAALKDNRELPCPHCDRIFKQQDRLKQHVQKQHADALAEQQPSAGGGDGRPTTPGDLARGGHVRSSAAPKISAKAALIQASALKAREDKAREAAERGERAPTPRMSCKLPSVILREFVQKKTDLKAPLFKAQEAPGTPAGAGAWTCKLVLRDKQGKKEKDRVFWWKDPPCATKQEAEHRVSVVALAAVASNLPLQRLLPAEYRGAFADAEAAERARAEDARRRAEREEERIARMKARGKAEAAQVLTMSEEKRGIVEAILRETWEDCSAEEEDRAAEENSFFPSDDEGRREGSDSDSDSDADADADAGGATADASERGEGSRGDSDTGANALRDALAALGFHRSDAAAASRATRSTDASRIEPAVSWLCVHVPESRLPEAYAPRLANDGGVVLLSKKKTTAGEETTTEKASAPARRSRDDARPAEATAAWLWDRGYPRAACEAAAREHAGNREAALAALFGELLAEQSAGAVSDASVGAPPGGSSDAAADAADESDWRDERAAIEAIVGEEKVRVLADGRGLAVAVEADAAGDGESLPTATLEVYRLDGSGYPSRAPPSIVAFHADGAARDRFRVATAKLAKLAAECAGAACVYTLFEAAGEMLAEEEGGFFFFDDDDERNDRAEPAPRAKKESEGSSGLRSGGNDGARSRRGANETPVPPPRDASRHSSSRHSSSRPSPSRARDSDSGALTPAEVSSESAKLAEAFRAYTTAHRSGSGEAFRMMSARAALPAAHAREEVSNAAARSRVLVLTGETGCGKSTQVPQFILEREIAEGRGGAANVVVTQPRRISAVGLAERVAAERCERCGDVVGYSVRLESRRSRRTRLLFCTAGVLLRRMLSDPSLTRVTHVVLDEVHERSVDSDLLLLLLRDALAKNPNLKVVLMSATADADLFEAYFATPGPAAVTRGVGGVATARVHVPGFTHPVREYFLEDVFEMTGVVVGRGGPYAKRKEDLARKTQAKTARDVEAEKALAERARRRRAERIALGIEDGSEEGDSDDAASDDAALDDAASDDDASDDASNVPEDWDLADDARAFEVPSKGPPEGKPAGCSDPSPSLLDQGGAAAVGPLGPAGGGLLTDAERRVNDALAEASRALANDYSAQTQRSVAVVDDAIINYDAVERLIARIIETEKLEGPSALTPPPIAGKEPKETDLGLGAVLVFMPGQFEITKLIRKLEQSRFLDARTLLVLPLYGALGGKDQRKIFERPPPGVRKIVVATNVAETSVTIDDVRYVIDTGRAKEMRWDASRGVSALADAWVSRAAAKQRRGRAGRVAPGARFAMFTRARFATMAPSQAPEMLRTPLQQLCLSVKAMRPDEPVSATLAAALTPPDGASVDAALAELRDLRALDAEERLTPLGRHLARMPTDARVGKMLLHGALLGCLDPILTIAAAMSGRPLFFSPKDARDAADAAKRKLNAHGSDHLTAAAAYEGWIRAKLEGGRAGERRYCDECFLSQQALEAVRASRIEYASILADLGFVEGEYARAIRRDGRGGGVADSNAANVRVVKAALTAGFYPHVVRVRHPETKYTQTQGGAVERRHDSKDLRYYSRDLGRVFLHPGSVNFAREKYASRWLVYSERVETAKVYVRDNTMVGSYALLLFGGDVSVLRDEGLVKVDDWATFQAPARIGVLVKELRRRVDRLLLERIDRPAPRLAATPIVRALIELLASEGH